MTNSSVSSLLQKADPQLSKKFAVLYERRNRESEGLGMVLSHFISDIEAAKQSFYKMDISDASSYDYSQRIDFFLSFVKYRTHIDLDIFLNFKKYLSSRTDYRPSTKNKYLIAARIFLKELARQGFVQDVTINVKGFQINREQHKRPGHNEQEIAKLTKKIADLDDTISNARLTTIFHLLVLQGLRQVEIVRLDVENIDLKNKTAFILGKGRDDVEKITLHPIAVNSLDEYFKATEIKSGPVFKSFANRKADRLTTRSVRRFFKPFFNDLDIEKTVHGFRHFFTTEIVKRFDIRTTQKMTRHKSPTMVMVYDDETLMESKVDEIHKACFKAVSD